jgi:hypothetical protein
MYNNYWKDLKFGQRKEDVTLNVLKKIYGLDGIIDNEENKHDIVLNNLCICEVKADKYVKHTRNIWLEYCGNIKQNKSGWLLYSDCHLLAYHIVEPLYPHRTIKILFFDFIRLKHYVMQECFDGDFSNPLSPFALKGEKENEKAILLPENDYKEFVVCEFSTILKEETFRNPKGNSLKDFSEFITAFSPLQAS